MKILQIVPALAAGGAETFVAGLSMELKKQGHDVDVFLMAGALDERGEFLLDELNRSNIKVYGAKKRSARSLLNLYKLIRIIFCGGYDIVHSHLYSAELLTVIAVIFNKIFGINPPIVRTIHNTNIYGRRSKAISDLLHKFFHFNYACGLKVKDSYDKIYGRDESYVIENGVVARIVSSDGSIKVKNYVCDYGLKIVCIGAFRGDILSTSAKAQDVAIESFCAAFSNRPDINLFFVGAGDLLTEAVSLVEKKGAKNIHFLGSVSDSGKILAGADLLFMPSRYEGLPIAALEAGIYGVPILASPIPELESIGKGMDWIFPENYSIQSFSDALIFAADNIDNIKNVAKSNIKKYKDKYGIERCAAEYVVQYNVCLSA